jgi:dihydropteroate synthase/2-amino-4-hydroxy-6-hydroxymethyldihydropteridine diphosphokinase
MYVTDQPPFLNAVVEMRTHLGAVDLLGALQRIERDLGRDPAAPRNGPRPVDLDIVLYDSDVITLDGGRLTVPHPRLGERGFVLRPLCDIDDAVRVPCAVSGGHRTARDLLARLGADATAGMTRVLPLRGSSHKVLEWAGRPKLMGIINTTPDSFSDGGQFAGIGDVLRRVEEFVAFGFDVVDVGGQSTRPGAATVPERVERGRVAPVVGAIRREHPGLAVSVDTFRSRVAAEALDAGADLVNDVSAGRLDANMVNVVRSKRCAWAMMHMRGTPETMMRADATDYGPGGVAPTVALELSGAVSQAVAGGVPRWDIVVDPGLGFAKGAAQSRDLARGLAAWKSAMGAFPCLVGLSRKSCLTHVVPRLRGTEARDRDFATAGAIVAAMYSGADILRVHNPRMADVVAVAHDMRPDARR